MKFAWLFIFIMLVGCSVPSEEDVVRGNRRKYQVELGDDFFVNPETQKLAYEIKVKNTAGELKLSDLTLDIEMYDPEDKLLWAERKTLDVSGINMNSTKVYSFRKDVEPGVVIGSGLVDLAPDDPESDYKTYPEFQRIVHK